VPHIFFLFSTTACFTAPVLDVASQDRASATQDRDRVAIKRTVTSFVDFALTFTEDADFTNVAALRGRSQRLAEFG